MIWLIALGAFAATFLGGLFALKFSDKLHLLLGFSAGAVLGVAFFDLLPEALELSSGTYDGHTVLLVVAIGFLLYMITSRGLGHSHAEDEPGHRSGILGAGSLSLHSLLDGLGIGLAFQVSPAVGLIVTAAVLTHDFSDGINTVNMILRTGGSRLSALRWLAADALMPVVGILISRFFVLTPNTLGLVLALFAGFFLYIGASDLLPESHHAHPTRWTTYTTVLGLLLIYWAVSVAHL